MSSEVNLLLEKATSPLLLDTDWDSTLQIVDLVRQGDINPKTTVSAILNKLKDSNPNVVLLALQVLECVVKNCGQVVHEQVALRSVMTDIHVLLSNTNNDEVRKKILFILSTWVHAFRNETKYRAVQDTVNLIKSEGYHMPNVSESDAMFTADRAPDWADGECCHRCRSQFTMLRRKHHCRACGQVFCNDCSSKYSTIPKFGIEREVRVCESCFDQINNPRNASAISSPPQPKMEQDTDSPSKASQNTKQTSGPPKKSEEELQEEEEFQLALALSRSEAENKEKEKLRATSTILGGGTWKQPSPATSPSPTQLPAQQEKDDMDPELAKYLNRTYWEQQQNKTNKSATDNGRVLSPTIPSAPVTTIKANSPSKTPTKINEWYQNGETEEVDEFMTTLRSQLEIFVNRMKSNQSRGRPIANDTAVQSLFMNITAMHSQLLKFIQQQDEHRLQCEGLQDKISQIRDARAALEALREEHRDKLRREKEEQERIRQIQMMQKLEIMRKKKQEYLEYQRQLALHRMAESEREMLSKQIPPAPSGAPIPGYGMPYQPPYPGGRPPMPGGYMYPMPGEGGAPPPQGMSYQQPPPPHGFQQPQQQGGSAPPPAQPTTTTQPAFPPGQGEFSPYNMTAMSNNLPNVSGYPPGVLPHGGAPPLPQHPGAMPHPQQVPPPQQQQSGVPPNAGASQPPPPQEVTAPPPQAPAPAPAPSELQAELISFD